MNGVTITDIGRSKLGRNLRRAPMELLSAGRLHGFGHLLEACVQLWGEGGARQVPNAQVAAVGKSGGALAGAMLVVRN